MKKWFSLLLLVVLLALAHLRRPPLALHQEQLYYRATGEATLPAAVRSRPEWGRLVLHDWFVVTLTEDVGSKTLVSFGFGQYIKVLDDRWVRQTLLPPSP